MRACCKRGWFGGGFVGIWLRWWGLAHGKPCSGCPIRGSSLAIGCRYLWPYCQNCPQQGWDGDPALVPPPHHPNVMPDSAPIRDAHPEHPLPKSPLGTHPRRDPSGQGDWVTCPCRNKATIQRRFPPFPLPRPDTTVTVTHRGRGIRAPSFQQ